jgi:hypothetical protein
MANEPGNNPEPRPVQVAVNPALTTTDLSVAEIRRDVQDLTRDVQSLTRNLDTVLKIIRDGNGQPPLLIRVTLMERTIADFTATLTDVRKALEIRSIEETKGKWNLVAVIITGLLALMSATVSAIILFKR